MRTVFSATAAHNGPVSRAGGPLSAHTVLCSRDERPNYPQISRCVRVIVGIYGVRYAAAAQDPLHQRSAALRGLLGKVLVPTGFFSATIGGTFQRTNA